MTAKYYKQLKFYCKHFNTFVDKKDKLAGQDQLNQKTPLKRPAFAVAVLK